MQTFVPETALVYGFRNDPLGTHTSRTIMLREVTGVFAATTLETPNEEIRRLILEDNISMKATLSTRKETYRRLAELYALNADVLLYSALRELWDANPDERPLLALLCALARDPLLRATAPFVLEQHQGQAVTKYQMEEQINEAYPDRYQPGILAGMGRRTSSSWAQSGHLAGHAKKIRSKATSGPASATFALQLAYLCGARGLFLYDTLWAKVLDVPPSELDSLAFAASQRGWLEYRRIGEVCEIRFSNLIRA